MARSKVAIAAVVAAVLVVGAGGVYLLRAPLGLSGRQAPVSQSTPNAPPPTPQARPPVPQPVAELFDKWRVQCLQDAESRQFCRAEQVIAGADGVPQLAVFASAPAAGRAAQLIIVPPWGLLVERGLSLQVDAQARFTLPIVSCQPTGCWAEVPINDAVLGQLRQGTTLRVSMVAADGTPLAIAVALSGFPAAYDRLLQKNSR